MKLCTRCATEKSLSEFKFIHKRQQHFCWCRDCSRTYHRKWNAANPRKPHPVEPLVYRITNSTNGKVYIGVTHRPFEIRMAGHLTKARNGSKTPIHAALRKYGVEGFSFEVIERVPALAELERAERRQIAAHNSMVPNGYNRTEGGGGNCGILVSAETVAKRLETIARNGGFVVSEETRTKLRLAHTGRKMPREAVESARLKRIGVKRTAEQCGRIAAGRAAGKVALRHRTKNNSKYAPSLLVAAMARVRAGEFQTVVARDVGIDQGYLSQLLSGKSGKTLQGDHGG